MNISRASDWKGFREALRGWYSPTHNFVYADDLVHIGLISAGYYPQVPTCAQPWLTMQGTGEFDVTGTIPFDPWWKSRAVPVGRQELNKPLGQVLEAWTLKDPTNRAFSAPGVGSRTATDAQRQAFHKAVSTLVAKLGQDPKTWKWGRLHTRYIENLTRIKGISYGPRPDRGDARTPMVAGGSPSTSGPSWRMVVDWGTRTFSGIYPGGQSENPASEWYTNRVETWWTGLYAPMLNADEAAAAEGARSWSMQG